MGLIQASTKSGAPVVGLHLAGLLLLAALAVQHATCASLDGGQTTALPSADIVIDSLAEEGNKVSTSSERHHYEQQVEQPATTTATTTTTTAHPAEESAPRDSSHLKAEPRNQEEQSEPVIVDHRPGGADLQLDPQQQLAVGTSTTTTQPPAYQPITRASVAQQYQISAPSSIQQQGWFTQSPVSSQQQQQSSQQNNNGQGFSSVSGGPQAAPSSQVFTVQHPTSINSIINEQQHQAAQQQQQPQVIGSQTSSQNSMLTSATVNGQPASLIVQVSPNAQMTNGQGRRVSISNWLKGISSMLANIFNRREHGTLVLAGSPLLAQSGSSQQQQQQPQASGSSPIGHWLQLGPNAPHWLTQAQSLIQQQQQHYQQQFNANSNPFAAAASSTRFTFLQAPQQQTPATMTITMQPTNMVAAGQYQPQTQPQSSAPGQDVMAASGSSPTNYLALAQPSMASTGQIAQVQPQPQTQTQTSQQALTNQNRAQQQTSQVNSGHQQASQSVGSQQQNSSPNEQQAVRFGRSFSLTLGKGGHETLPLAHYSRIVANA